FFFYVHGAHLFLHSFPTRRSSDLRELGAVAPTPGLVEVARHVAVRVVVEDERDHVDAVLHRGRQLLRVVEEPTVPRDGDDRTVRSEEHTSELQSLAYLVCRLLLEK